MKAEFKTRLAAYLIDLIIIGLLMGIVMCIKEKDPKVKQLKSDRNIVNELYANKEIKFEDYFERRTTIDQQIDQECVIYMIYNIILIICYFILLPYYWNGQTVGKKALKIKIVPSNENKITITSLLIRNLIINGLGYIIMVLLFLYLLPNKMYFVFESIFSFLQIILVILSISMILYRRDKRGLHDILSGTKVCKCER